MSGYYSRRNDSFNKEITFKFWNALKAYINEISDNSYFHECFGDEYYDFGQWHRTVEKEKVNRRMLQEIGLSLYPLSDHVPNKDTVFDLIEFFFKFISIPANDTFDRGKATYQYTIRVNQLFENFKLSYKLEKGSIKERHSGLIDKTIADDSFIIEDKDTQNIMKIAVEKFYNRKSDEQSIGLEKLVDTFQRVSSWEDENKKRSVGKMLEKLSLVQPELRPTLEAEVKTLWDIANTFMIRHTEMDKIKIVDSDFMEYLFYRYYNTLRLIFRKYAGLQDQEILSNEDFIPDND